MQHSTNSWPLQTTLTNRTGAFPIIASCWPNWWMFFTNNFRNDISSPLFGLRISPFSCPANQFTVLYIHHIHIYISLYICIYPIYYTSKILQVLLLGDSLQGWAYHLRYAHAAHPSPAGAVWLGDVIGLGTWVASETSKEIPETLGKRVRKTGWFTRILMMAWKKSLP